MLGGYSLPRRERALPRIGREALILALLVLAAAASALAIRLMGYFALLIPLYGFAVIFLVLSPEKAVLTFLALGIAIEPAAMDWSRPVSYGLYELPPMLRALSPITVTPMEIAMVLAAVVFIIRGVRTKSRDMPGLPLLAYAVPIVAVLGVLYGMRRGGQMNLAYEEMRGFLYGACAFFVARRMTGQRDHAVKVALFAGSTGLAVVSLLRYFILLRSGTSGIALQDEYAHEDAIFLAMGFIVSVVLATGTGRRRDRLLLILHAGLMLAAIMVTGRRAGTLVLGVGVLTLAWLYLPKRPQAVIGIGIPVLILTSLYLGAYWNKDYGAIAQPARAIRSQFAPSARDASSDQYRVDEIFNVQTTLRLSRVFGVGLGRPFGSFRPLPDLTSFWSLQWYTPHENLLWLWLWGGITGISCVLGLWVIALKRCLVAIREAPTSYGFPIIVACMLTMYIAYARVDQVLIGSRSLAPLAIAMAVALSYRRKQGSAELTPTPDARG